MAEKSKMTTELLSAILGVPSYYSHDDFNEFFYSTKDYKYTGNSMNKSELLDLGEEWAWTNGFSLQGMFMQEGEKEPRYYEVYVWENEDFLCRHQVTDETNKLIAITKALRWILDTLEGKNDR